MTCSWPWQDTPNKFHLAIFDLRFDMSLFHSFWGLLVQSYASTHKSFQTLKISSLHNIENIILAPKEKKKTKCSKLWHQFKPSYFSSSIDINISVITQWIHHPSRSIINSFWHYYTPFHIIYKPQKDKFHHPLPIVLHHKHHHHAYHLQKSFLTPIINMFCFQNGLKHTIMVKKCCNKFFEIVWLSTFSNPMFKNVVINYIQIK